MTDTPEYKSINRQAIDLVWSGNYAPFDFLTESGQQCIAYYDANRQMSVAHREDPRSPWVYYKVDSWVGWDTHNYIEMALDKAGHLHLAGNMHGNRLEYFRTRYPGEVRSLERVAVMEDPELESRATYPRFLKRDNGDLVFKYRSGGSGNGSDNYLLYNVEQQSWQRLHEGALIDGQGSMNAYAGGPAIGPDGKFHMVWIWRDSGDAATNHDISYARSPDLVNWETSSGQAIPLPITFEKSEIIDPVQAHGGAINGNNKLGFDAQNRPIVAFHKYDADGNTQIYLSRRETEGWVTRQITDWKDFRWSFGGYGALSVWEVLVGNPELLPDGNIKLPIKKQDDRYELIIDGETLERISTQDALAYPPLISEVASSDKVLLNGRDTTGPELIFRTLSTGGFEGAEDEVFYISWEAQGPFRDQAREAILPPSSLILHHLKKVP